MKATALDLFVIAATLFATVFTAYALVGLWNHPSAPQTSCCDLSYPGTSNGTTPSSSPFVYTTTQTLVLQSASNVTSLSALVSGYFKTELGTQTLSTLSVNTDLASKGNVDLVLLQRATFVRVSSCEVGVTPFQRGTYGASPCLPATDKKLEPVFMSFDGQYYDYSVGPLALPFGNYALQVRAEFNFVGQNDSVTYILLAD